MINKYAIAFAVVMIGLARSDSAALIAQGKLTNQNNFTKAEKQSIIVTWLDANKIKSDPVVSISSEDFWKFFDPLVEQSINGSRLSFK
jgi:hypothetical protein